MSIRDELVAGTFTGNRCQLCAFLAIQSPAQRAQWEEELARPVSEVGNQSVVVALKRRRFTLSERSVRRHRTHARP